MSSIPSAVITPRPMLPARQFTTRPGDHRFFSAMAIVSSLTIVAAVLAVLAAGSGGWGLLVAAGVVLAVAIGCFVGFVVRRPQDAAAASRVPDGRVVVRK